MSHTMNINIEVKDIEALKLACERLNLKVEEGTHRLYSSTEKGVGVYLPGWKYPVVFREDRIAYDNYNGNWGDINELNKLLAYYGLEKAKKEARKNGYTYYESYNEKKQQLELRIQIP